MANRAIVGHYVPGSRPRNKAKLSQIIGSVPTTPDPNTSAKVSRYKWEAYRDTNWWCIYYLLPGGGAYFCKSIAIEMGGVSQYFSKVSGSGVGLILLNLISPPTNASDSNRCENSLSSHSAITLARFRPSKR